MKQLLREMVRLREMVVNQRLHGWRTAAAVPPERGVRVAVASSERIECVPVKPGCLKNRALLRGRVYDTC